MDKVTNQDNAARVRELANNALRELDGVSEISNTESASIVRNTLAQASVKVGISPSEVDASLNAAAIRERVNQIIQAVEDGVSPVNPDQPISEMPNPIKILCIGNSHTADAWSYVPFILKQYGINCIMVLCLTGADYLWRRLSNYWYENDVSTGRFGHVGQVFYIDTSVQTPQWSLYLNTNNKDPNDSSYWWVDKVVQLHYNKFFSGNDEQIAWDLVSLQPYRQAPTSSTTPFNNTEVDNLCTNVDEAFSRIAESIGKSDFVKTVLLEHVEYPDAPYVDFATKLINNKNEGKVDLYIPVGQTIYRMRAQRAYRGLDTQWSIRNFYGGDNSHLCEGLPSYSAAVTVVESIFRYYNTEFSISDSCNTVVPNSDNVTAENANNIGAGWRVPWRNPSSGSFVAGVDSNWDNNKNAAILAAKASVIEINSFASGSISDYLPAPTTDKVTLTIKARGCNIYNSSTNALLCADGNDKQFEYNLYDKFGFNMGIRYELTDSNATAREESYTVFDNDKEPYYPWHIDSLDVDSTKKPVDISGKEGQSLHRYYTYICFDVEYTITTEPINN